MSFLGVSVCSPESSRQRAYGLVAQAYTSITEEDLAAFVGYSVEEAVKGGSKLLRPERNTASRL